MPLSDADRELLELQRSQHMSGPAAGTPSPEAVQRDPDAVSTWEQRRAAQREAHGQYVAAGPIHIGNALAFVTGMAVPLEHVIRYDLWDKELVYRVANPEQARAGKTFDSDDEFHKANPHAKRRSSVAPELHPAALDPRGGAAAIDDERKAADRAAKSSAAQETVKAGSKPAGKDA